jgi:hypothetical protein
LRAQQPRRKTTNIFIVEITAMMLITEERSKRSLDLAQLGKRDDVVHSLHSLVKRHHFRFHLCYASVKTTAFFTGVFLHVLIVTAALARRCRDVCALAFASSLVHAHARSPILRLGLFQFKALQLQVVHELFVHVDYGEQNCLRLHPVCSFGAEQRLASSILETLVRRRLAECHGQIFEGEHFAAVHTGRRIHRVVIPVVTRTIGARAVLAVGAHQRIARDDVRTH